MRAIEALKRLPISQLLLTERVLPSIVRVVARPVVRAPPLVVAPPLVGGVVGRGEPHGGTVVVLSPVHVRVVMVALRVGVPVGGAVIVPVVVGISRVVHVRRSRVAVVVHALQLLETRRTLVHGTLALVNDGFSSAEVVHLVRVVVVPVAAIVPRLRGVWVL